MCDLLAGISRIEAKDFDAVVQAVVKRHGELFPDWEINVMVLEKKEDRNNQIDEIIHGLENMKTSLV